MENFVRQELKKFYKTESKDRSVIADHIAILIKAVEWYQGLDKPPFYAIQWFQWHLQRIETVYLLRNLNVSLGDVVDLGEKSIDFDKHPIEFIETHINELNRVGKVLQVYYASKPKSPLEWVVGWLKTEPTYDGYQAQKNFLRDVMRFQSVLAGRSEYERRDIISFDDWDGIISETIR